MKPLFFPAVLTLLIHALLLSGLGGLLLRNDAIQEPKPISLSLSLIRRPALQKSALTSRQADQAQTGRPESPKAPESPAAPPVKPLVPVDRLEQPPPEKPAPPRLVAPRPKAPEKVEKEKKQEVRPKKKEPATPPKKLQPAKPRPEKRPEEMVQERPKRKPLKEIKKETTLEHERPEPDAPIGGAPPAVPPSNPFADLAEKAKDIYPQTASSAEGSSLLSVPVGTVTEAVPIYRQNPIPEYPLIARRRGYEGMVVLEALITEQGRVKDLRVAQSSHHSVLDEAALDAVKDWLFEPAKRGSQNIEMWVKVPVCFRLK